MNTTRRVRRAGLATVAALVIGGSGVAIGAAAADSSASGTLAAATATQSPAVPGPATPTGPGPDSYASVVRQVLPSVVLIRTENGLGSGVVLDTKGNIVTNAHVAGDATKFQVQVAGDTAPRSARLVPGAGRRHAGDTVTVTISRDGQDRSVQVTLGELPGS
jgi:S1-C subfamily serine protease